MVHYLREYCFSVRKLLTQNKLLLYYTEVLLLHELLELLPHVGEARNGLKYVWTML